MADNDDRRTPNGCSCFHGRCFDKLELQADPSQVYAWFHDGSEYLFMGLDPAEAILWVSLFDQGCYFNKYIWPGDYVKVKGPG
jgi:hypothetical protein